MKTGCKDSSTRPGGYEGKGGRMKKLLVQAITNEGCCVYATVHVSNDYTMNEIVREIKRMRYVKFRLVETMKAFADIK